MKRKNWQITYTWKYSDDGFAAGEYGSDTDIMACSEKMVREAMYVAVEWHRRHGHTEVQATLVAL